MMVNMFQPLSSLFSNREKLTWQEVDVRYFIQDYLRRTIKSDQVLCQSVQAGRAVVWAASPVLQQEIRLLEYDVRRIVKAHTGYTLSTIKVLSS